MADNLKPNSSRLFDDSAEGAKYRVAKSLLRQGHDPHHVAKAVGLSQSEVKRLAIQVTEQGRKRSAS